MIKGDLKWFSDDLGMRNVTSRQPCDWCPCHRIAGGDPTLAVFNFNKRAAWKSKLFSVDEWKAFGSDHPLFAEFSWLSQMSVECDELHVLHLGVSQMLLGSVIWTIVYHCMRGTYDANLQQFWTELQSEYQKLDSGNRYTFFNGSLFHDPVRPRGDFPRLKGRGIEIKHAVEPILEIFQRHARVGNIDDKLALGVLSSLVKIQNIFEEHSKDYFLTPGDAATVQRLCDDFLDGYATLHNRAAGRKDLLWGCLPKHHVFWHLCNRCRFAHPRLGNCCLDEDYVGKIKQVVVSTSAGLTLHKIPNSLFDKLMWGMAIGKSIAE